VREETHRQDHHWLPNTAERTWGEKYMHVRDDEGRVVLLLSPAATARYRTMMPWPK
jgi:hypothetical protein